MSMDVKGTTKKADAFGLFVYPNSSPCFKLIAPTSQRDDDHDAELQFRKALF